MKVKTANFWLGGEEIDADKRQAVQEPINGFTIRAGDNSGQCYATKKVTKAMAGGEMVKPLSQES